MNATVEIVGPPPQPTQGPGDKHYHDTGLPWSISLGVIRVTSTHSHMAERVAGYNPIRRKMKMCSDDYINENELPFSSVKVTKN